MVLDVNRTPAKGREMMLMFCWVFFHVRILSLYASINPSSWFDDFSKKFGQGYVRSTARAI